MRRQDEEWLHYWARNMLALSVQGIALPLVCLWHNNPVAVCLGTTATVGAVIYAISDEGEITGWVEEIVCFLLLNRISLTIMAGAYAICMAIAGRREK